MAGGAGQHRRVALLLGGHRVRALPSLLVPADLHVPDVRGPPRGRLAQGGGHQAPRPAAGPDRCLHLDLPLPGPDLPEHRGRLLRPEQPVQHEVRGGVRVRLDPVYGGRRVYAHRGPALVLREGERGMNKKLIWIIGGVLGLALIVGLAAAIASEEPIDENVGFGDPTVEGQSLPMVENPNAGDPAPRRTAPTGSGTGWTGREQRRR